jgi:hypothetical protein
MFAQKALETIEKCIKEHQLTKELIIEQMKMYLDPIEVTPGSGNYTYVYQWSTCDPDSDERKASILLAYMRVILMSLSDSGFLETQFYSSNARTRAFEWH